MDTTIGKRGAQKLAQPSENVYNHDLNMFRECPSETIILAEFEELALDRLRMLRVLEQASLKGHRLYSDEWKAVVKEDLVKNGLKKYRRLLNGSMACDDLDVQARRADHLSHFILRLAYCRSEDLRKWFLSREMEWFKLKFLAHTHEGVKKFLISNNLIYFPIDNEEKSEVRQALIDSTYLVSEASFHAIDFYKVPFIEVLSLVKNRKAFLKDGYAYITINDLVLCVLSKFRAELSESLNVYCHRLPFLDDERLNIITDLHNAYTGQSYTTGNDNKDTINPADIDVLAKQHFPLCMQHIHNIFRTEHHLKHNCRLLYGLFLKGIGLLYDDAMEYWRSEFTKKMDNDKFEKSYSYNIKHMYGKAGKMVNYSPFSCHKIIMEVVGPGQHHGCPFKHWDASIVRQKLVEKGFGSENVESVISLVNGGHYQMACTKYFEHIHGQPPVNTISHPNQYYTESVALAKNKDIKKN